MSEHILLPEGSLEKQTTTLNLGPTHPATHGVFQNILELDGERVMQATSTVGYIHRAFEKIAERRTLYQTQYEKETSLIELKYYDIFKCLVFYPNHHFIFTL